MYNPLLLGIQTIEYVLDQPPPIARQRLPDIAQKAKPVHPPTILIVRLLIGLILELLEEDPILTEYLLELVIGDGASERLVESEEGFVEGAEVRHGFVAAEQEFDLQVQFVHLGVELHAEE